MDGLCIFEQRSLFVEIQFGFVVVDGIEGKGCFVEIFIFYLCCEFVVFCYDGSSGIFSKFILLLCILYIELFFGIVEVSECFLILSYSYKVGSW